MLLSSPPLYTKTGSTGEKGKHGTLYLYQSEVPITYFTSNHDVTFWFNQTNRQWNSKISIRMKTNTRSRECKVRLSPSLQVEHQTVARRTPTEESGQTSKGRPWWPSKRTSWPSMWGSQGPPPWQGPCWPSCPAKWLTHTHTPQKFIIHTMCTVCVCTFVVGPLSTRHRWRNPFIVDELYLPRTRKRGGQWGTIANCWEKARCLWSIWWKKVNIVIA